MSLRLAVLFYRNRSDISLPVMQVRYSEREFHLAIEPDWLAQNSLTESALQDEIKQWKTLGIGLQIGGNEWARIALSPSTLPKVTSDLSPR
jgi:exopolyphosphatase/guanosine-5'-triphosphate,3'-diphosphate pyrophosphatase